MPSRNDYLDAREKFIELLKRNTKESEWQKFFSEHPYVLSESLPLRLEPEDLRPQGRPGKSEPDFIFYPKKEQFQLIYGVIELKRPDTPILRTPRKNILRLSSDAQTALAQAQLYANDLNRQIFYNNYDMIALGNELHAFLILGISSEISKKVTDEILRNQYKELMPSGFRLIPYDVLFKIFESRIPPQLYYIVPQLPISISSIPIIDYTSGGYVTNISLDDLRYLMGVRPLRVKDKDLFVQKKVGSCLYCGEKQGYNSLSEMKYTPGGTLQRFEYGFDNGKLFRILRCNKLLAYNGMPLEFREIYEKDILLNWLKSLKNNFCERCNSKKIEYKRTDNIPVALQERWECKECGFYDEICSWGSASWGA